MVTVHKLQTAKKDERRSNWKEKLVIMEKNNALWQRRFTYIVNFFYVV